MLLYNWKKILRYSGGSSKRVALIIRTMLKTDLPRNKFDPTFKYYYEDFSGLSFLVHPEPLINNSWRWRPKEVADYIGLASFRSLGEYRVSKKVTLDLSRCPMGEDAINKNRLLHIDRGEIHFLYEDYTGE